jgi:hypothetical protein
MKGNDRVIAFHNRAGAILEHTMSDRLEFGFWPSQWQAFRSASHEQIAAHRIAQNNAKTAHEGQGK